MTRLLGYVDPSEPHFVAAVLTIAFNPLFWNVAFARMETPPALHEADDSRPLDGPHFVHVPRSVARWEHKTRKLSGAFGSPHLACCTLGGAILLLNVLRSHCFTQAMLSQPRMQSLDNPLAYRMGLALLGVGGVFVLSSFLALGFTGTFLGRKVPAAPRPRALCPQTAMTPLPLLLPCLCLELKGRRGEGPLVSSAAPDTVPVSHASRGGFSGRPHAPLRLLRDPEGDQSDHVPVQRPGQPHVLGQHSQLPGLGHHARQPRRPAADHGGGAHLHGRHPV
ncbi:phosphatidylethanolamine N-methyltransferase isoform X4 [Delphinapterus leucas]|nr:phosphatidylethanolamine N-methyltransferase isoform X4 [Delphinapterus leucas]XP_022416659.2 phosphatidylethanolamine N-methyltransferase isoform X4 [Delphinapterus leucas]XP_022416660.2 phosphatidylethanolamine N-methyltransferase isoform X4 [Delphinapterus leucas]